MKLSFCINKGNDIYPFGKDEYVPKDKLSELTAEMITWPFEGEGVHSAFNKKKTDTLDYYVSSFLSTAEKDDDIDVIFTDDDKTVNVINSDVRKTAIEILLGSYRVILNNSEYQSLVDASKAHVQTLSSINKDSVLFDSESKDYVDRNDFTGLLAKLQAEKATIITSDTTFRSKIVALARMIRPFKLNDKKTAWTWQDDRQDVIALEKLVDGILSDDSKNAVKNLKSITLGSMDIFDNVYKDLSLNPSSKSDWSFVMSIGQSLNRQNKPFADAKQISNRVPIAYSLYKNLPMTSKDKTAVKKLSIENFDTLSNQKKCQMFMQAISNKPGNASVSVKDIEKKIEILIAQREKAIVDVRKRFKEMRAVQAELVAEKQKLQEAEAEKELQEDRKNIKEIYGSTLASVEQRYPGRPVEEIAEAARLQVALKYDMQLDDVQKALSA